MSDPLTLVLVVTFQLLSQSSSYSFPPSLPPCLRPSLQVQKKNSTSWMLTLQSTHQPLFSVEHVMAVQLQQARDRLKRRCVHVGERGGACCGWNTALPVLSFLPSLSGMHSASISPSPASRFVFMFTTSWLTVFCSVH